MALLIAAAAVVGYLLGSIPFAVLASRLFRLPDPRTFGSGNPGATNVLRTGNRAAALFTLLGDAFKGTVAVLLARAASAAWSPDAMATMAAAAGLAAFVGHVYPVFLAFRGGKGVATFLGVLLALDLRLAAGAAATWVVVAALSRYSSVASMSSACVAGVLFALTYGWSLTAVAVVIMAALLIARHRSNIAKLSAGTEGRIGAKRPAPPAN